VPRLTIFTAEHLTPIDARLVGADVLLNLLTAAPGTGGTGES
jgi:hypothetical protein